MSDPQSIAVFALIGLSAAYVGWTAVARFRKQDGKACGSACSGCMAEESKLGTRKALVTLEPQSTKKP